MIIFVGCSLNSSTIENVKTSQIQIINGWKAHTVDYPSVVAIGTVWDKSYFCTGTLIASDLVLTAGHCVSGWEDRPESLRIYVNTDNVVEAKEQDSYVVAFATTHPEYEQKLQCVLDNVTDRCELSEKDPWNDVALLLLKKRVLNAVCAPLLMPADYDSLLWKGASVRLAGYGRNDLEDSGILYAGDVPIIDRTSYELDTGINDPKHESTGACYGDSGGPAYVVHNGKVHVTGVTSRATSEPVCGTGAIYSLPGSYNDWISFWYNAAVCVRDAPKDENLWLCVDSTSNGPTWPVNTDNTCPSAQSLPAAEPKSKLEPPDSGHVKPPVGTGGTSSKDAGKSDGASSIPSSPPVIEPSDGCALRQRSKNNSSDLITMFFMLVSVLILRKSRMLQ